MDGNAKTEQLIRLVLLLTEQDYWFFATKSVMCTTEKAVRFPLFRLFESFSTLAGRLNAKVRNEKASFSPFFRDSRSVGGAMGLSVTAVASLSSLAPGVSHGAVGSGASR